MCLKTFARPTVTSSLRSLMRIIALGRQGFMEERGATSFLRTAPGSFLSLKVAIELREHKRGYYTGVAASLAP